MGKIDTLLQPVPIWNPLDWNVGFVKEAFSQRRPRRHLLAGDPQHDPLRRGDDRPLLRDRLPRRLLHRPPRQALEGTAPAADLPPVLGQLPDADARLDRAARSRRLRQPGPRRRRHREPAGMAQWQQQFLRTRSASCFSKQHTSTTTTVRPPTSLEQPGVAGDAQSEVRQPIAHPFSDPIRQEHAMRCCTLPGPASCSWPRPQHPNPDSPRTLCHLQPANRVRLAEGRRLRRSGLRWDLAGLNIADPSAAGWRLSRVPRRPSGTPRDSLRSATTRRWAPRSDPSAAVPQPPGDLPRRGRGAHGRHRLGGAHREVVHYLGADAPARALPPWQTSRPDYNAGVARLGLARGDGAGDVWCWTTRFLTTRCRSSAMRSLAAALARALEAGPDTRRAAIQEVSDDRAALRALLAADDYRYFEFELWQEGGARYTEYAVARAAAGAWDPSTDFRRLPDYVPSGKAANTALRDVRRQLERLDLAQQRRVAFYPIGGASGAAAGRDAGRLEAGPARRPLRAPRPDLERPVIARRLRACRPRSRPRSRPPVPPPRRSSR